MYTDLLDLIIHRPALQQHIREFANDPNRSKG